MRLGWALSRRSARQLIERGRVTVNGRHLGKGAIVAAGDEIRVSELARPPVLQPNPNLKFETLYQDASILVVNKPGPVPCHPLKPSERDTLVNAVIAAYPEVANAGDKPLEGGLVHRLDNGTSGALIIARTADAFAAMRTAIRRGDISRRYLALCVSNFAEELEIATPVAHHPKNRRKMITQSWNGAVLPRARPAATLVRPLQHFPGYSLIEAQPRTGRRHQIRVHLASIGHPLLGDTLYGGPQTVELPAGRFWLHLSEVAFESPSNGYIKLRAPLPADLDAVLNRLLPNRSSIQGRWEPLAPD